VKNPFLFCPFISWKATWISTKHNLNWQKWYKSRYKLYNTV